MTVDEGTKEMDGIVDHLNGELAKIRAGRATPDMLDTVSVEVYEAMMPIKHVATISVQDARTVVIQPWDTNNVKLIEKAIQTSDLGLSPVVDGKIIRVSVPALTGEMRDQYVKEMKERVEDARVALRGVRHKVMDGIEESVSDGGVSEDDLKRMKDEAEKVVKEYMDMVEEIAENKEKELTTV